jgi:hypothetical protein
MAEGQISGVPSPGHYATLKKEPPMSRLKTYGLVLALLASAALSTACTRTDATGPSDQEQASFESIGANN